MIRHTALLTTLEQALLAANAELEREWMALANTLASLHESSAPRDDLTSRLTISMQSHDRHTQVLEDVIRALGTLRDYMSDPIFPHTVLPETVSENICHSFRLSSMRNFYLSLCSHGSPLSPLPLNNVNEPELF